MKGYGFQGYHKGEDSRSITTVNSTDGQSIADALAHEVDVKKSRLVIAILDSKNTHVYSHFKSLAEIKYGIHSVCCQNIKGKFGTNG